MLVPTIEPSSIVEGPGAPSPMQAEQAGASCGKRPAPETPPRALAPAAGGSTEKSNKRAKKTALAGPRASFALATESSITLAVVLPPRSSGSQLVELVLKFVEDRGAGAGKSAAPKTQTVKVDDKQRLNTTCILVKLPDLKLGHSCALAPRTLSRR